MSAEMQLLGEYWLTSESDTDQLGTDLANWLPSGATVGLCGTLGAGKTRLVRSIAAAIGVPSDQVTSPTFTLVQTYEGSHRLHHVDTYRIADSDEFFEVGLEELFEEPDSWKFVEWADRFAALMPDETLWLRIDLIDDQRRVRIEGKSAFWESRGVPR